MATHYVQIAAVVVPIAVGTLTLSVAAALMLFLATELLLLAFLPRVAAFRRSVDARLHQAECERAAAARAVWLARMGNAHRAELQRLEELTARIRRESGVQDDAGRGDGCDWLGLDSLLATYVDLAIRHQESVAAFSTADDLRLAEQIRDLEARMAQTSATGSIQVWAARRHAVLCQRRDARRRASDARAQVIEELATITAVVEWMHEEAAIVHSTRGLHSSVASTIEACMNDATALRELTALVGDDEMDPEVLRLGRDPALKVRVAAGPTEVNRTFMQPYESGRRDALEARRDEDVVAVATAAQ